VELRNVPRDTQRRRRLLAANRLRLTDDVPV
jgi:hypothetical protein